MYSWLTLSSRAAADPRTLQKISPKSGLPGEDARNASLTLALTHSERKWQVEMSKAALTEIWLEQEMSHGGEGQEMKLHKFRQRTDLVGGTRLAKLPPSRLTQTLVWLLCGEILG